MNAATTTHDPSKTRRLELILRQVDALPTLPVVATRLMSLTTSDDSDVREVIQLVSSDQALTAKVLSMCRAAHRGVRDVNTVDKAVVLLGFDAIRNAVLSIKVIEALKPPPAAAQPPRATQLLDAQHDDANDNGEGENENDPPPTFDHVGFWRHCLAVAIAAEQLAAAHPHFKDLKPAEAFVCGLLHDVGKLALERILPKSYERVVELVEINQGNVAEFERRIIGMDHHTAGKRLAEHWNLPHLIQDCIWLHGAPYDTVPQLGHRRMIGLVSLADLICRTQHLGYSGNFQLRQNPHDLAKQLELSPAAVDKVLIDLHEDLSKRSLALGLDDAPSEQCFLKAIQQANEMLGRLNGALGRRSQVAARQGQVLDSIVAFHGATSPGRSVDDVLSQVVASASNALGQGYYATVYQSSSHQPWLISLFDNEGRVLNSNFIDAPPGAADLSSVDPNHPAMLNQMGILPWLADYLGDEVDVRQVRLLPMGCGWGTAAVLVHDRPVLPQWQLLSALTSTWGAAIAAAAQHDGARRLGEQLADANNALAEAQDRLLRNESLARVGEMAAGAAHEMNNPLAVISGRSQLLTQSLPPGTPAHKAAATIVEQSHRLSDLITSLRLYSDPPKAERRLTELANLLDATVKKVSAALPKNLHAPVYLKASRDMPAVWVDPQQIEQIVTDLLTNALQALPKTAVNVNARIDAHRRTLTIQVSDDGVGMDEHTLSHAMDPFFSARPAGRNVGMGLPRANQLAAAHGGTVALRSTLGEGTLATVSIPLDCDE